LDSTAATYKTELQAYQDQYNAILKEIGTLAKDSSYQGVNLLKDGNLTVMFNETRTHSLTIDGDNVTAEMANKGAAGFAWENAADTNDVGNGTIDWVGQVVEEEISTTEYTVNKMTAVSGDNTAKAGEGTHYTKAGDTYTVVAKDTTLATGTTYYTKGADETITSTETYTAGAAIDGDYMVKTVGDTTTKSVVTTSAASVIDEALTAISNINTYLRSYATELGNNFSIIETRQNFTDALVDVLETGSDNLVLADMNEESANYLALQTRQQLAINSLSLASQSAQSVLSLF